MKWIFKTACSHFWPNLINQHTYLNWKILNTNIFLKIIPAILYTKVYLNIYCCTVYWSVFRISRTLFYRSSRFFIVFFYKITSICFPTIYHSFLTIFTLSWQYFTLSWHFFINFFLRLWGPKLFLKSWQKFNFDVDNDLLKHDMCPILLKNHSTLVYIIYAPHHLCFFCIYCWCKKCDKFIIKYTVLMRKVE